MAAFLRTCQTCVSLRLFLPVDYAAVPNIFHCILCKFQVTLTYRRTSMVVAFQSKSVSYLVSSSSTLLMLELLVIFCLWDQ